MQPRSFTSQRTYGSPALALGERRAAAGVFSGTSPEPQGGGREEKCSAFREPLIESCSCGARLGQRPKASNIQGGSGAFP